MLFSPRHLPRLAATVGLFTKYGLADLARAQGMQLIQLDEPDVPSEKDERSTATLATAFGD